MVTSSRRNKNKKYKIKDVPKKKRRLKVGAISIFLLLLITVGTLVFGVFSKSITNIYISGNKHLSDQEIIEIAKIQDYPSTFKNLSVVIKNRLENDDLIIKAKVRKKWFTKVYIDIEENQPLFFNDNINKTVFTDGLSMDRKVSGPTLLNYVPDTIYDYFVEEMKKISVQVLERTSEIIYQPNDVDEERFLFIMEDGNYVYLTLNKFNSINNYVSIIKKFEGKKGILYLDSGEYFKLLDN